MKKNLRKILCLLSCLSLLVTLFACNDGDAQSCYPEELYEESDYSPTDWMASLSDDLLLSQITLPGSHDSGACNNVGINAFAATQTYTVEEQLAFGVRAFDIRLQNKSEGLKIFHGDFDQNILFSEIIEVYHAFLEAHPAETIVMFVKNEGDDDITFCDVLHPVLEQDDMFFLEDRNPTLGEVRGKVVFIRRYFSLVSIGINAKTGWSGDIFDIENAVTMHVQDNYHSSLWKSLDDKWTEFMSLYDVPCRQEEFYINFSSCYVFIRIGRFEIPDIKNSALKINKKIREEFSLLSKGYYGMIFMDYVDSDIAYYVLSKNFDIDKNGFLV